MSSAADNRVPLGATFRLPIYFTVRSEEFHDVGLVRDRNL